MNNNYTEIGLLFQGLVTNVQYTFIMEFCSEAGTILAFIGIISNVINIRIFCSMGLTDGITVSFLSLSIFDLAYLIPSFSMGVSIGLGVIELRTPTAFVIEPQGVSILMAKIMVLVNITNVLTTTFLAVARCMCVAKPLHFKNWFTKNRALGFILSFVILAVASYAPVTAYVGIVTQFDVMKNITRPILWVSPKRESVKVIAWIIKDLILPFATQFIVVVCVVIMASSLRISSRFRQSAVLTSEKASSALDSNYNFTVSSTLTVPTDKLSRKDVRVVQQVVLISVVYIVCNTPKMVISTAVVTVPDFTIGKRYSNLYLGVIALRHQFEILNDAVNTFIYYRYNTKFRTILLSALKRMRR
ncbi:unnamed protein product [Candidula unifasciata]|uniref:G-protein coupled receptors family 1 profile domain-containing protein n=1 Tax=Candidula unifasciata TaxID=100452 RepID=A0A8S3Z7P3_9EUPU|nr:unnamed protein product [Candidula unifasciata]